MYRRAILRCLLGVAAFAVPGLAASDPVMEAAMASYKAGQYPAALQEFVQLEKKYPNSALVHYYVALCKQNIGRSGDAKSEYQWVMIIQTPN